MKAWLLAALAAALALLFAALWWRADHRAGAEAQARQQTEADYLREHNLAAARERTVKGLEGELDKAVGESAALRQEVERAKAAVKVRVVEVVSASTGPVVVTGEPRREPERTDPDNSTDTPHSTNMRACMLAVGDSLELQVRDVRLQTEAGNTLVLGSAQAWRVEPRALLVDAPFTATSAYVAPQPVSEPWWHSALWAAGGFAAGAVAGVVLAR